MARVKTMSINLSPIVMLFLILNNIRIEDIYKCLLYNIVGISGKIRILYKLVIFKRNRIEIFENPSLVICRLQRPSDIIQTVEFLESPE